MESVGKLSAPPVENKRPSNGPRNAGKQKVAEGIERRAQTDEIIAGWWRFFPLAAVAFGIGGIVAFAFLLPGLDGLIFGYVVMYIAGFAMLAILTYKQTRRIAGHVAREAMIRQGMMERLRSKGDQGTGVKEELSEMERIHEEALGEERLPNPLYAAMTALPLVGLPLGYYYLYHLNQVPAPHDSRWLRYLALHSSIGSKLDVPAPLVPPQTLSKRPFALYAIVSLVFFPFLAYWYHVMIHEVNEHFKAQWKVEDELLLSFD
jgi:hypothetical protein